MARTMGTVGVDEAALAAAVERLLGANDADAGAWARAYAAAGLPVFPLYEVDETGRCACWAGTACANPGKHPRTRHGMSEATADAATVAGWWRRWPRAHVAVATGAAAGVVVLDVDGATGRAT